MGRRIHPFVLGHLGGALVAGGIVVAFVNFFPSVTGTAVLVANALIATLICSYWPGFKASGWRLWLTASLANPLVLIGGLWSAIQYECLIGHKTGWDCVFAGIALAAAILALLPPLFGVGARWYARRSQNKVP